MKIKKLDQQRLVIVDFPWFFAIIAFGMGILLLSHLAQQLKNGPIEMKHLFWYSIGFVIWFFVGCFFIKRSVFEFDLSRRQLVWKRIGLFIRNSGIIPFDQIKCAAVDCISPFGTYLEYRVVLATTHEIFPLRETYEASKDRECDQLRNTINEALEVNRSRLSEEDGWLLEMSASKQRLEAIEAVAKRFKVGLARAARMVDRGKRK
jgi:hypothetical protein